MSPPKCRFSSTRTQPTPFGRCCTRVSAAWALPGTKRLRVTSSSPPGRLAVSDHDLSEMTAALEMPVGRLGLGKGECPVDHGTQAMQRDGPVHCLKIRAAPDADRSDRNAAAGQQ